MSLLKEILKVLMYKLLMVENIMAYVLAKLANELAYPNDEYISIKVQNYHILAHIGLELIKFDALKGKSFVIQGDL